MVNKFKIVPLIVKNTGIIIGIHYICYTYLT